MYTHELVSSLGHIPLYNSDAYLSSDKNPGNLTIIFMEGGRGVMLYKVLLTCCIIALPYCDQGWSLLEHCSVVNGHTL